ncbi:MAG: ATP-binding protein [Verrucomicrobia bacterium]|nr:ATP-binding protein [Verrucomicrobiota bacterium]
MTVILTHVQNALAEGGLSEAQREAFEACQRAAQRMRRMIESLLQLARLDAGQEKGRQERVDLAQIGGECLELMRPLAAARRIVISEEWVAAECHGDAGQLGQVITNLIGNAIHHGPEGGEVRVSSGADESGAWVVVKDNGPGIAPEHAAHIFERFYRVDKARTGAAGRTGLGLAISQAIVAAHGGKISVESAAGKGATFTVRVPRGTRPDTSAD